MCTDLNVLGILIGLQGSALNSANVKGTAKWGTAPLQNKNIVLPLLHIKLSLTKIFVQAVDKESEGFGCLMQKFPQISEAKLKKGVFVGPQIKQLFKDQNFSTNLNSAERRAWKAFDSVQKLSRQWKSGK